MCECVIIYVYNSRVTIRAHNITLCTAVTGKTRASVANGVKTENVQRDYGARIVAIIVMVKSSRRTRSLLCRVIVVNAQRDIDDETRRANDLPRVCI